jgi:hypothetical protein
MQVVAVAPIQAIRMLTKLGLGVLAGAGVVAQHLLPPQQDHQIQEAVAAELKPHKDLPIPLVLVPAAPASSLSAMQYDHD